MDVDSYHFFWKHDQRDIWSCSCFKRGLNIIGRHVFWIFESKAFWISKHQSVKKPGKTLGVRGLLESRLSIEGSYRLHCNKFWLYRAEIRRCGDYKQCGEMCLKGIEMVSLYNGGENAPTRHTWCHQTNLQWWEWTPFCWVCQRDLMDTLTLYKAICCSL